jgi:hypothetical protein
MKWSWNCLWLLVIILLLVLLVSIALKIEKTKKKPRKILKVSELRKKAKTGDLLLFSTMRKEVLPPILRKAAFGSEWTHSGILYFDPETEVPYVWEMNRKTPNGNVDILTGELNKDGAQLVDLKEKLKNYEGYCMIRMLKFTGQFEMEDNRTKLFQSLFTKFSDRKFNLSPTWVALVVLSEWFGLRPSEKVCAKMSGSLTSFDKLLCSELTVISYQELGVWSDPNYPPIRPLTLLLPHHFSEGIRLGSLEVLDEYELN